jgi:hypothetical protein
LWFCGDGISSYSSGIYGYANSDATGNDDDDVVALLCFFQGSRDIAGRSFDRYQCKVCNGSGDTSLPSYNTIYNGTKCGWNTFLPFF